MEISIREIKIKDNMKWSFKMILTIDRLVMIIISLKIIILNKMIRNDQIIIFNQIIKVITTIHNDKIIKFNQIIKVIRIIHNDKIKIKIKIIFVSKLNKLIFF